MNFQVRLPNDAVVTAIFTAASATTFVEERSSITDKPTFDDHGPDTNQSWRIILVSDGEQEGWDARAITGGPARLVRFDGQEFQVGFNCHEFREIGNGDEFRFSTQNADIIEFMQTMPQIENR